MLPRTITTITVGNLALHAAYPIQFPPGVIPELKEMSKPCTAHCVAQNLSYKALQCFTFFHER